MLTRFCDTYSPWWVETIILPTHTYDSCTNNRLSIIYLAAIKSAPCNPIDALYLYTNIIYYFCTMPMVCTILRFGGWVELHSHHETLIPKRQYVDHIMLGFAVILPHILQSKIVFLIFSFSIYEKCIYLSSPQILTFDLWPNEFDMHLIHGSSMC